MAVSMGAIIEQFYAIGDLGHRNLPSRIEVLLHLLFLQSAENDLLDPADDVGIDAQVMCQPIGRHLLVESLQGGNLAPEFRKDFLPTTGPPFHIPASCPIDSKRPTEHALATTTKFGPIPKDTMRSRNHAASSLLDDYETP